MKKLKIKYIYPISTHNTEGININGFEIWGDGVIYNTLSDADIPQYIFKLRNEIVKDNKIILTSEIKAQIKELILQCSYKLDKLTALRQDHTLKYKRIESDLENMSLLLY